MSGPDDRLKIRNEGRWDNAIGRYEPGDTATIYFVQRGVERSAEITFVEDSQLEVTTYESADMQVSDSQLSFRKAWLGLENED